MTSRILPAIALVLAFILFFVYVSPTYSGRIADTKTAIARDQSALDAAAEFTKKENQLAEDKSKIPKQNLDRLNTFLPSGVNNVGVILDLTALATRSGVQLTSINALTTPDAQGDTTATTPIGSVDLTISAAGTYPAFRAFMAGIEKSARLLDIINLTIKGSDTGVYTYDMKVRLYWLR